MLDRRRFSPITPFRGASVYGDVPEYVNDFVNGIYRSNWAFVSLSDAITFSRASNATMVNSEGVLVTVGPNVPRLNHHVYNGDTFVNKGLLHESDARTNFLTYSEDFTDASWGKVNTGTLAVDTTGPDGQTSAVTLSDSGAGGVGQVRVQKGVTVSANTKYTLSVFAKEDQLANISLIPFNFTTPPDGYTYFDISSGVVGDVAFGHTATIEDYGNGWYRCAVTFTTDGADTSGVIGIQAIATNGNAIVDLDGTSSVLIYGAQFEEGSTPSSYTPTAGATATRAAETLTIPAANLPWNPLSISIQMQGEMTYADNDNSVEALLYDWSADSANYARGRLNTSGSRTGELNFYQSQAGTVDLIFNTEPLSSGLNVPFNFCVTHASTFVAAAVNGTALITNTTPTALPDLSATDLQLGYVFMGTIRKFRFWADDIGEAGITEASS